LTAEVVQKAIAAAKKAHELAPTSSEALATYIFLQLFSTLWTEDDLSPLIRRLELLMERENKEMTPATVVPMRGMVLLDFDKTAKGLMRRWSLRTLRDLTSPPFHNSPHLPLSSSILTRPPRLRIGYISGDLGVISPLPHLVADMFGLHDFSRFEIFVYCTKPNDGVVADWKDMKASIQEPETHWRDLSALSERAAAETIFKDSVQVLIDLNGFTVGQRIDILAYHPAPLQATYLGWPGTMGAPFVDYVITDRIWNPPIPEVFEGFVEKLAYVETVAFMTSFQKRYMSVVTAPPPIRGDYHLPQSLISQPGGSESEAMQGQSEREVERETGFVFSNFNQAFKIDPSMFRRWMSILRRVPNSVLWLVMHTFDTTSSLRSKAKAQGVDPLRLIWAPFARNKTEYLYRSRLADLHLDNWIYNSGTTGADALWSGVPILTLYSIQEDKMTQKAEGNSRASRRMSSSLLGGVGLFKELVARTEQEYEDRAVELALGYQREEEDSELGRIKKKLGEARLQSSSPLFDTERQVREMERLVDKMWSQYARGLPPTHLLPP
jgi:protein O-GlcNAc transferase